MNDGQRLSKDPTFRQIGSGKIWERGAVLTSRLQTVETEMHAGEENFGSLAPINREIILEYPELTARQHRGGTYRYDYKENIA